ncbi:metallophosphoesterase [Enterococcus sp. LJL120]
MKKYWGIVGVGLLLLAVFIGISWSQATEKQSYLTTEEQTDFWLITDPHFLAPSLHDDGEAFQFIQSTAAGKDLRYQEESLTAFVDQALTAKPTGIIITGDLTLNGEKVSAEKLAEILAPLEKANIPVLCIPGNHDIYDGWARSFADDQQNVVASITPDDFKNLFPDGFTQAASSDPDSLSYTINLNQTYRLFFLDTNIYSEANSSSQPTTNGVIADNSLEWLTEQLQVTKDEGQTPVVFMHHNLYMHNSQVNKGYVLDNADEVKKLFTEYQVPIVFSGHIHAQDILGGTTGEPQEVVTSSFAMTDQAYGVITLNEQEITYQRENLSVDEWAQAQGLSNPDLLNYRDYLKDLFLKDSQAMTYSSAYRTGDFAGTELTAAADLVAELNWNFFTGHDLYTADEKAAIQNSAEYQFLSSRSDFLPSYLDSLMTDTTSDQEISIPLSEK